MTGQTITSEARERLTLIVCTRNRLPKLQATLPHLLRLPCRTPWQLVVVDNGSTDGTWRWIRSLRSTASVSVDVVSEPVVGTSRARSRGMRCARGDIVAFTDDDCYPTESFLNDVLDAFSAPDIGYCGGRILLHDSADLPISIRTSTKPELFPAHTFVPAGAISGGNMAFRRTVLDAVGQFDVLLGVGAVARAAEDSDFVLRASWCGFTGLYSPALTVRHHHERKSNSELYKVEGTYDLGRGAYYVKHLRQRQTRLLVLKNWYWRTDLRSRAGIRRLLRELQGALLYLWYSGRRWLRPTVPSALPPGSRPRS